MIVIVLKAYSKCKSPIQKKIPYSFTLYFRDCPKNDEGNKQG